MSSSPLPSPEDLLRQRPASLQPAPRKAPIPPHAPAGFMSAADILLNERSRITSSKELTRASSDSFLLDNISPKSSGLAQNSPTLGSLKRSTKEDTRLKAGASKAETPKISDAALAEGTFVDPALNTRESRPLVTAESLIIAGASQGSNKNLDQVLDAPAGPVVSASKRGRETQAIHAPEGPDLARLPKRSRKAAKPKVAHSYVQHNSMSLPDTTPVQPAEDASTSSCAKQINATAYAQTQASSVGVTDTTLRKDQTLKAVEPDVVVLSDSSPAPQAPLRDDNCEAATSEHFRGTSRPPPPPSPPPPGKSDWTPSKDLNLPPSFQYPSFDEDPPVENTADLQSATKSTQDNETLNGSPSAISRFTNLVGNFEYKGTELALPQATRPRDASEKPAAKRKRAKIAKNEDDPDAPPPPKKARKKAEPKPKASKTPKLPKPTKAPKTLKAPKAPKAPKVPKAPKEPKPKAPKKAKSPRKKPLTITELAIGAYRVQPLQDPTDSSKSISEFFTAPSEARGIADNQEDGALSTKLAASERKPVGASSSSKPKKSKKKVAIQEPVILTKLESPETAQRQLKEQEWLFGSSSQLVSTESSTELRDLQRVLKESEEFVSTQRSEDVDPYCIRAVSCARVPSAPHGTSLSIGQAQRDLWCSAARDFDDSTFLADEGLGMMIDESSEVTTSRRLAATDNTRERDGLSTNKTNEVVILSSQSEPEDAALQDSGYVDIDDILNDVASKKEKDFVNDQSEDESDDVPLIVVRQAGGAVRAPAETRSVPTSQLDGKSVDQRALKPLDPNIGIKNHTPGARNKVASLKTSDSVTAERTCGTLAATDVSEKRPRGRPRKILSTDTTILPKRRGRPPKVQAHSDTVRVTSRAKLATSTSAHPDSSSPYLDIDDISDPEEAAAPPSPPRRRASATLLQPTLELSNPLAAPPIQPRTNKQLQSDFPTISQTLFPLISETVKLARPTEDPKCPSWYEKILLYDPIVLEDLTAWLNGEGVRIASLRPRGTKKTTGRAKQKESHASALRETEQDVEMETCSEELKPWMVQKWCEENSVCCLWKGGLRGGVRAAY